MTRKEAIETVLNNLPSNNYKYISATGFTSRELYGINNKNNNNLYIVGSMGHTTSFAAGLSLNRNFGRIVCFDGDGGTIMHMGSMLTNSKKGNMIHIILNNGSHESVGEQTTYAKDINFNKIAKEFGYKNCYQFNDKHKLSEFLSNDLNTNESCFIEIKTKKGITGTLPRPTESLLEIKENFINNKE